MRVLKHIGSRKLIIATAVGVVAVGSLVNTTNAAGSCSSDCETYSKAATKDDKEQEVVNTVRNNASTIHRATQKAVTAATSGRRFRGPDTGDAGSGFQRKDFVVGGDDDLPVSFENVGMWGNMRVGEYTANALNEDIERTQGGLLLGIDAQVHDKVIVGISGGLSVGATDSTQRLAGAVTNESSVDTEEFTFAPYAAFLWNDNIYFDGTIGWTWGNLDQTIKDVAAATPFLDASQETSSRFYAANVNYIRTLEAMGAPNLMFSTHAGVAYTEADFDADTGTVGSLPDSSFSQTTGAIGAQLTLFADQFQPFIGVRWDHAFDSPVKVGINNTDGGGLKVGKETSIYSTYELRFGADFFPTDKITGSGEVFFNTDGHESDEFGISANVRYEF